MNILIASDHGGFELKEEIVKMLEDSNIDVEDLGPYELDTDDDYPVYAFKLAEQMDVGDEEQLGILICRSGNGMAIAANKVKGVRAALCFTIEHARKAREHDHANILVLDSDYLGDEVHMEIVEAFMNSEPEMGGRHERRVAMITEYEEDNL